MRLGPRYPVSPGRQISEGEGTPFRDLPFSTPTLSLIFQSAPCHPPSPPLFLTPLAQLFFIPSLLQPNPKVVLDHGQENRVMLSKGKGGYKRLSILFILLLETGIWGFIPFSPLDHGLFPLPLAGRVLCTLLCCFVREAPNEREMKV